MGQRLQSHTQSLSVFLSFSSCTGQSRDVTTALTMEPHCSENHGPGQDSRVLVPSSLESTEYQPTAGEVMEMARVADNADPQGESLSMPPLRIC